MNQVPPPPARRPLTPEERARRRAAYQRRRRAQQLRLLLAAAAFLVLLFIILIAARACRRAAPAAAEPLPGETETEVLRAPVTTAAESEPAPAEPTRPAAVRCTATDTTVTLGDEIASRCAVLVSLSDHTIVAEKHADEVIYPASITKVMSLIVACERIADPDETFTVTAAIIDPLYRQNASMAGFAPGETVTVRELLYGMVLPSGAEAAASLAICAAGSEEAFVGLMNEKAAEMGLTHTHFTNCVGLHDDAHTSTCVELAMILEYALADPTCREILSTYQHTTAPTAQHPEGILLTSTMFSRMVGDEPEGATILAGKTGYTTEARQCLASYAERDADGAPFLFVSVDAPGKFDPVFDAIRVYSDYTAAVSPSQIWLP